MSHKSGPYEFKLSIVAKGGLVQEAVEIEPGAWAWYKVETAGQPTYLGLYACCPDCCLPMTLWRRFGDQVHGHQIDAQGNIHPSVAHTYKVDGVDKCGFHTQPTKLLDFIDLRGTT